jgi:hypothetical protein
LKLYLEMSFSSCPLRPSWSWLYVSWIYNYLCYRCLSPLKLWVWTLFMAMCTRYNIIWQASTLTFFLTCPFGQRTNKSTCLTQSFSCPMKINKNYKNQRIIISNLCKMFWLLSCKHYFVLSLLILTDIMIMTSLIDQLTYN